MSNFDPDRKEFAKNRPKTELVVTIVFKSFFHFFGIKILQSFIKVNFYIIQF